MVYNILCVNTPCTNHIYACLSHTHLWRACMHAHTHHWPHIHLKHPLTLPTEIPKHGPGGAQVWLTCHHHCSPLLCCPVWLQPSVVGTWRWTVMRSWSGGMNLSGVQRGFGHPSAFPEGHAFWRWALKWEGPYLAKLSDFWGHCL